MLNAEENYQRIPPIMLIKKWKKNTFRCLISLCRTKSQRRPKCHHVPVYRREAQPHNRRQDVHQTRLSYVLIRGFAGISTVGDVTNFLSLSLSSVTLWFPSSPCLSFCGSLYFFPSFHVSFLLLNFELRNILMSKLHYIL